MGIYMPMRPRLKRVASAPGLLFPAQEPPAPEGESLRHFVQGHKCPSSLHNKKPAMSYNLCIPMKQKYDFSHGKRGRIAPPEPEPRGKTRITIRLDEDWWITSCVRLKHRAAPLAIRPSSMKPCANT